MSCHYSEIYFTFNYDMYSIQKLSRYTETYWRYKTGFKIRNKALTIDTIDASKTWEEQQTRIEKISLVSFLSNKQKKMLLTICRRLKRNNADFYQNRNLHVTLIGFGPLEKQYYEKIQGKIGKFCRSKHYKPITIRLDTIRLGIMYSENKSLGPIPRLSNGTVIAIGNIDKNMEFNNFSNQLTSFLLQDKNIRSESGSKLRRKFPTVWITLGYYNKKDKFKIGSKLENIFRQYDFSERNNSQFGFSISELSLVRSKYKNLRYPTLLEKYKL